MPEPENRMMLRSASSVNSGTPMISSSRMTCSSTARVTSAPVLSSTTRKDTPLKTYSLILSWVM